jgi:hypothetical protein
MARSEAKTVEEYLAELPRERREVVTAVRETILHNLPRGYVERMNWGMISYEIPLERYGDTYNRQPLSYAALAAQKSHYAIYLMCLYADAGREAWLREQFQRAGKKLDMGKSCVRFRRLEDVPLDVIGEAVASTPPEVLIARAESARRLNRDYAD